MITLETRDGVAVATLSRSVTNPINGRLLDELSEALNASSANADIGSFLLRSASQKFFSIGFDIPELFELPEAHFRRFFTTFNRVCLDLYRMPKPTLAVLGGHAVAGGCILALCCDYRFIASGRKLMGLNEVRLGVPMPYVGDRALRDLVGGRLARELTENGEFYPSETLLAMGLVDRVAAPDELESVAFEHAKALGVHPRLAFGMIKRNRVEGVESQILARLQEKEELFIQCWFSDATRRRLKEAMEKF